MQRSIEPSEDVFVECPVCVICSSQGRADMKDQGWKGYLTEEGLHRTCASFREECSLFHNGNNNLDQVFLTSDLKTILEDYSQLKETGRENGTPTSSAVLKSLWRDLDVVIGQLKYATIPTNTPKVNTIKNQSTRTRRLNTDLLRRNTFQKNQVTKTPTLQGPVAPSSATEKLPLPRLPKVVSSNNQSSSNGRTRNLLCSNSTTGTTSRIQSSVNKDSNVRQTSSNHQPVGVPVADVAPVTEIPATGGPAIENERQITGSPGTHTGVGQSHTTNEKSSNEDAVESMIDIPMDDGDFGDAGYSSPERTPVIVISDESSNDQEVSVAKEHGLSDSNPRENEIHLQSPKRKGVHPRRRVPQGDTSQSEVAVSTAKQVPKSNNLEVEMDVMYASDTLTPQSFLGTLLNTPILQEKLAENINKVVGSSRTQPASDDPPTDSAQTVTITEDSSDDILMASNPEAGGDIPVKEIMDLMQADPAFDVLFSLFGIDALDALPSTTDPSTVLAETSQAGKVPVSESQFPDTLAVSESSRPDLGNELDALPSAARRQLPTESSVDGGMAIDVLRSGSKERTADVGHEVASLSSASRQHLNAESTVDLGCEIATLQSSSRQHLQPPSSSSASELHMSAASIVTDALLLLAGSPQKALSNSSSQSCYNASDPTSKKRTPITPPKVSDATQKTRNAVNENEHNGHSSQPALITSTLPYVRALNFTQEKELEIGTRGRKKGSKNKKGTKQKPATNKQTKAPRTETKETGKGQKRAVAKASSQLASESSSLDTGSGFSTLQGTSGVVQPSMSYESTFNRTVISNSIPVNGIVQSSNAILSQNCSAILATAPAFVPISVTPSPSPVNIASPCPDQISSAVTMATGSGTDSSGCIPSTGIRQSSAPVVLGTTAVPSTGNLARRTATPVNFMSSDSVQVSSPLAPGIANLLPTPPTLHSPLMPLAANVTHKSITHLPMGAGFIPLVPNALSAHQTMQDLTPPAAISTTATPQAFIPGSLTESPVIRDTAGIGDLSALQKNRSENDKSNSTPSGISNTDSNIDDLSPSGEPFSLKASNMLQTLAFQYKNIQGNSTHHHNQAFVSDSGQQNNHSLQKTGTLSVDTEVRLQPLQEKSPAYENVTATKSNTEISGKKHADGFSAAHSSPCTNQREQEIMSVPPVGRSIQCSLQTNNGPSTSPLTLINQESSDLVKENFSGSLRSKLSSEKETQESSTSRTKRSRDEFQQHKKKRNKSLSRPSKRSKTKGESMHFPSNLNVEEFLSKLHYEDK